MRRYTNIPASQAERLFRSQMVLVDARLRLSAGHRRIESSRKLLEATRVTRCVAPDAATAAERPVEAAASPRRRFDWALFALRVLEPARATLFLVLTNASAARRSGGRSG